MKTLGMCLRIEGVEQKLGGMSPSSRTKLELFHVVAHPFKFGLFEVGVGFVVECTFVRGRKGGGGHEAFTLFRVLCMCIMWIYWCSVFVGEGRMMM